MTGSRTESDLLGNIDVPAGALYGAQTQRAILNFPTAAHAPLVLIRALLKRCCASNAPPPWRT